MPGQLALTFHQKHKQTNTDKINAIKTDSIQITEKFNKVDQKVPWNEHGDQNLSLCKLIVRKNNNVRILNEGKKNEAHIYIYV